MTFAGFPSRAQATAIPNVFLSDLLPRIVADAAAVSVALFAFHAVQRKKGFPRYVTAAELAAEPALLACLEAAGADRAQIAPALERLAAIGMLVPLTVERDGAQDTLYFLNAPADRRGLEAVRSGGVDLGRVVPLGPAAEPERSSIFALYESLIGTVSPLVADELAEAERLYPPEWLEGAFREAAAQNARSWRYVSRILERWSIEGPEHAKAERGAAADDRYFAGKYGRILRQRLDR